MAKTKTKTHKKPSTTRRKSAQQEARHERKAPRRGVDRVSFGGGGLRIPGTPGVIAKNRMRVVMIGGHPKPCKGKLPAGILRAVKAAAAVAVPRPMEGPVAVGLISYWPKKWGPKGRADGRPQGDVDAPLSNLLDALTGVLYRDDAQVAIVVAANAYDPSNPRLEVVARPLSPSLLAAIATELGLPFDTARLTTGRQEPLL